MVVLSHAFIYFFFVFTVILIAAIFSFFFHKFAFFVCLGVLFWTLTILSQHFQSKSLWPSPPAKIILGYFCAGLPPFAVKHTTAVSRQSSCCQNINSQLVGMYLTSMWPPRVNMPVCCFLAVVVRTTRSLLCRVRCSNVSWYRELRMIDFSFGLSIRMGQRMMPAYRFEIHQCTCTFCSMRRGGGSFLKLPQDFKGGATALCFCLLYLISCSSIVVTHSCQRSANTALCVRS